MATYNVSSNNGVYIFFLVTFCTAFILGGLVFLYTCVKNIIHFIYANCYNKNEEHSNETVELPVNIITMNTKTNPLYHGIEV